MNSKVFMKKIEQLALKNNIRLNILIVAGETEGKPFELTALNTTAYVVLGYLDYVKSTVLVQINKYNQKKKETIKDPFPGVQ